MNSGQFISHYWHLGVAGLSILMSVLASGHAVLYRRDPRAAFAWGVIAWLVPLGGAVLYFIFGVNRIRRRAAVLRESFHSLDLVVSKDFQFDHCDGTVRLKLVNLLNSEDSQVFEGTSLPFSSFHPGLGVSLSAELNF